MKRDELKRVIEARHNVSGYSLEFIDAGSDDDATTRLGEPRAELRETEFFDKLAEESGGNTRLALFYWLRSLEGLDEDESTVQVRPLQPLYTRFLETLRTNRLLALATLITHGGLSLSEFASVFRCSRDEAQAILSGLKQRNLLYVEPGRINTYRINPVLHRPIADVLRERHIL